MKPVLGVCLVSLWVYTVCPLNSTVSFTSNPTSQSPTSTLRSETKPTGSTAGGIVIFDIFFPTTNERFNVGIVSAISGFYFFILVLLYICMVKRCRNFNDNYQKKVITENSKAIERSAFSEKGSSYPLISRGETADSSKPNSLKKQEKSGSSVNLLKNSQQHNESELSNITAPTFNIQSSTTPIGSSGNSQTDEGLQQQLWMMQQQLQYQQQLQMQANMQIHQQKQIIESLTNTKAIPAIPQNNTENMTEVLTAFDVVPDNKTGISNSQFHAPSTTLAPLKNLPPPDLASVKLKQTKLGGIK